jgi:hypothetical protein
MVEAGAARSRETDMSKRSLIGSYLADHGLAGDNLTGIVDCAMSNGDFAEVDKFVEDLATAPWFRAIVERWPMLGHEIWASPEIMEAEPDLEQARAILVRDGASREASVFADVRLQPVDPAVLDWLDGRLWDAYAPNDTTLPIAIDALRVLGPDALPETEVAWIELMQSLASASHVLGQLGPRPAQMLGADGLRKVMAIVGARSDPERPGKVDLQLAGELARAAFGPAGDDLVDCFETDADRVAYAHAIASMPVA